MKTTLTRSEIKQLQELAKKYAKGGSCEAEGHECDLCPFGKVSFGLIELGIPSLPNVTSCISILRWSLEQKNVSFMDRHNDNLQ